MIIDELPLEVTVHARELLVRLLNDCSAEMVECDKMRHICVELALEALVHENWDDELAFAAIPQLREDLQVLGLVGTCEKYGIMPPTPCE